MAYYQAVQKHDALGSLRAILQHKDKQAQANNITQDNNEIQASKSQFFRAAMFKKRIMVGIRKP